jgi:5-formyltetrahydrofolate cyclo-ligase
MTSPVGILKRDLRRRLREVVAGLEPDLRRAGSAAACQLLAQQAVWQQAKNVLLYSPMPEEVDIRRAAQLALASGKLLALLFFDSGRGSYAARQIEDWGRDLVPGSFGILEPAERCPVFDLKRLDFALVPGLGFTADGRRLGRGMGYYDRVLAQVRGFKCGVAFDQQVVDEIPAEAHDVRLDCILTPTRWCQVPRGAVLN